MDDRTAVLAAATDRRETDESPFMIDDATPLDDARLSCARDTAVNADAESSDIERAS